MEASSTVMSMGRELQMGDGSLRKEDKGMSDKIKMAKCVWELKGKDLPRACSEENAQLLKSQNTADVNVGRSSKQQFRFINTGRNPAVDGQSRLHSENNIK